MRDGRRAGLKDQLDAVHDGGDDDDDDDNDGDLKMIIKSWTEMEEGPDWKKPKKLQVATVFKIKFK